MFSDERRQKILYLIKQNGRVLVKDLAADLNISVDSIRRDLSIMEDQGLLKRTHGGAISVPRVRNSAQAPSIRYGEGSITQNAIAKSAVSYIEENQTLFIGGAAVHYAMIKHLPNDISFTVVTNSIEVAYLLKNLSKVQTFIIGGSVKNSGNITDSIANEFVRQFTFDLCFTTAGGLSTKGLSTATPEVSVFNRTVFNHSKKIIALIEHFKVDIELFSHMCPIKGIDIIISDEETDMNYLETIKSQGVEVLVAKNI
ncbi:DeoR/GlpR family DNA-binding transcription regulator [Chengkuizengella axinellae]|uniref:DeoR/GlpR family DNA-binding transcription regulator n=1 Tax=Chengkuizengella axinellae TaxID=3064388 RepID=A0ABT9J589_9BACL|nr:DeoR/GlpR family DNA-binding transcription regulator [Chengkuizengella sp. 2205SS18-9]MDP5276770.1 DeoR/GlpR family DNA-binding transcription regulator [Chengkuizengella sp. 2205SS18-9]